MTNPDNLAAMGLAQVEHAEINGQPAIRKGPLKATEHYFYRQLASHPDYRGPATPKVLQWDGDTVWLERIPHAVGARETHNSDLLGALAQLHAQPLPVPPECRFRFRWQPAEMQRALVHFPADQVERIAQRLLPWYQQIDAVLEPQVMISGDTNHGNWGRRDQGDWVLFDWERLSYGSPAIDLAPLIPGLSDVEVVRSYVQGYRAAWSDCPWSEATLVRQVVQVMAVVAIEVVNILHDNANAEAQRYQQWFNQHYLAWLDNISSSSASLRSHI